MLVKHEEHFLLSIRCSSEYLWHLNNSEVDIG